jgi:hypothetical protein
LKNFPHVELKVLCEKFLKSENFVYDLQPQVTLEKIKNKKR